MYLTLKPKVLIPRLGLFYAISLQLYFFGTTILESSRSRISGVPLELIVFAQNKEDFSPSIPQT